MSSIFNVNTLGIKNFDNLVTENIKDNIKNNRVLLTTDINSESYKLTLPSTSPKFNINYLIADDDGNLTWSTPLIADDILPTSPSGPPLIYENGIYVFSSSIKNMTSIQGNQNTNTQISFDEQKLLLKKNNTFVDLKSNKISLGVSSNDSSAMEIMEDKIIINKPLILGRYKLEVIDDELIITKYDPNTGKYIPGTIIL